MIAHRMGQSSDPHPSDKDNLSNALRQFAAPLSYCHGHWVTFKTEAEAVQSVIAEIGQTVLARRTRVSGKETGASLFLTITNRHLAEIEGAFVCEKDATVTAVCAAIVQALAGCHTLKFEVIDRNPELPKSSRSWTHDALAGVIEGHKKHLRQQTSPIGLLVDDLKARSLAWLRPATAKCPAETTGAQELVDLLVSCETHRLKPGDGSANMAIWRPSLSIWSGPYDSTVVFLKSRDDVQYFICRAEESAAITESWRAFLISESPV